MKNRPSVSQKLIRTLLAVTLLAVAVPGFSPGVARGETSLPEGPSTVVTSPSGNLNNQYVTGTVYGGTSVASSVYELVNQEAALHALARKLAARRDKSGLMKVIRELLDTREQLNNLANQKPNELKQLLLSIPGQGAYFSGAGSASNPYLIYTAQDLNNIRNTVSDAVYYKLMNNIDLSVFGRNYNDGAGWTPIGDNNRPFNGYFNGNGHEISGLYINDINIAGREYNGLFGVTSASSDISNTGLKDVYVNVYVSNSGAFTGSLAGLNNGSINNCYSTGSVTSRGMYIDSVGGLVGLTGTDWFINPQKRIRGVISNSYFSGSVTGTVASSPTGEGGSGMVGGLVGWTSASVSNSYATGNITGSVSGFYGWSTVGGLIGVNYASVSNSYATGSVANSIFSSDGWSTVGGLLGSNGGSVSDSYATSGVSNSYSGSGGESDLGGLVGFSGASLDNSYAISNVSGSVYGSDDWGTVGGLVGFNDDNVSTCYCTGSVSGIVSGTDDRRFVGGLMGLNNYQGSINDSYWDIDTTGQTSCVGENYGSDDSAENGRTTAQMKQQTTFVGWDFVHTWGIDEGKTYPYLLQQNNKQQQLLQILQFELGKFKDALEGNDPVDLSTGNFIDQTTDLRIPTRGLPLEFTRFYNSMDSYSGPLGPGWTDNYNTFLTFNKDGSISVKYGDGHVTVFTPDGSAYKGPAGCFETLASGPDNTYVLTFKDQTRYTYDSAGQLISEADRNGNTDTLGYQNGLLSSLTGPEGRSLHFTYDSAKHLTGITDPVDRAVYFSYDQNGDLAAVRDVRGGITRYTYGPHGLTDVTDPDGHHILHNDYDSQGRVVSQTDARGDIIRFTYDPAKDQTVMIDQRGNSATFTYDSDFRITRVDYPDHVSQSYTYDANWNRASVTDKDGHTTKYTYDADGNLFTQTDPAPLNYTTTYRYNSLNDPVSIVDAAGHTTTLTYDAHGNLTSVTRQVYGGTATTSFAYNPYGQLIASTDADGHTTKYGSDRYGNLTSVTDPLGHTTTYTYDAVGRLLTRTDALGHTTRYTYDAAGNLLSVTDPLGHKTVYAYDPAGNRITMTDPRGNTTTFAYNADNKLVSRTGPLGGIIRYGYDAENNLISVTDAVYHTTTYTYDYLDRLTSVTGPDGHTETYTLDGNGNRVAVTDRDGHTTRYTYDVLNRPVTVTDALGDRTTFRYDSLGNRTAVTDPRGYTTKYVYGPGSRLLSVTGPLRHTTFYAYDPAGNLTGVTNPLGYKWTYGYDADNRQVTVTDPLGHVTKTLYDAVGNVVSVTDADGNTTRYGYNPVNELTSVTDALNHTTRYGYDTDGNLVKVTNARGYTGTLAYDADNRLVKKTDPLGLTTGLSYDAVGNLVEKVQPDGTAINYTYDGANRLTGIAYPDQGGVTYTYDPDGNRTSMTDPAGTTSYRYNALGRLTHVDENGESVGYTYDRSGNITGITYPNGLRVTYTYNGLDQPVSVSDSVYSATISYDAAGRRTAETLPNGVKTTYTYDPVGRLTAVQSVRGQSIIAESAYTLDSVGNRLTMTDAKGKTTRYTYNRDYELTAVRCPDGRRETYTYDPAGNRTHENGLRYLYDPDNHLVLAGHEPYLYDQNGNLVLGGKAMYLYDDANRLTNVLTLVGFHNIQYTYDGDGYRTSRTVTSLSNLDSSVRNEINREMSHLLLPQTGQEWRNPLPPGQLKKWIEPADGKQKQHGLPGILRGSGIPDGLTAHGFLGDRSSVAGSVYEQYIYDFNAGLPLLLAEENKAGKITDYLYDGHLYEAIMAQENGYDAHELGQPSLTGGVNGWTITEAGHGSTKKNLDAAAPGFNWPVPSRGNHGGWWPKPPRILGGRIFYQQDGLGSVSAITNVNGKVLERYSYDAFGEPRIQGEPVPNPFLFTGEPYDQADGLLYLRARYYDPELGRFLSQDAFFGKLTLPLSQNGYGYAVNNPILYMDPTGHLIVCQLAENYSLYAVFYGHYLVKGADYSKLHNYYWSSLLNDINSEKGILNGNAPWWQKFAAWWSLQDNIETQETLAELLTYNNPRGSSKQRQYALQQLQEAYKANFNEALGMAAGSIDEEEILGEENSNAAEGEANAVAKSMEDIFTKPEILSNMSPEEVASLAEENGWTVNPLGKGRLKGVPYSEGGGLSIREIGPKGEPTDSYIQWHPGGGHHGEGAYWKISSGNLGSIRIFVD